MTWLLVVFCLEQFKKVSTSVIWTRVLELQQKIRAQNYDPSLAGDSKIWVKAYCVPKNCLNKWIKTNDGTNSQ